MSTNRHLNIFHHYTQASSLPIENNISRGLAILLQEYPDLFMLLIEKIREKDKNGWLALPDNSYLVDFQRKTDDFGEAEKIIGIALTASELSEDYDTGKVKAEEDYVPITDISIEYDSTIIFIEVKRNDTDCRKQLEEQMDRYLQSVSVYNRIDVSRISKSIISISWTDIITMLKRYMRLHSGRVDRLVVDYYEYLVYHYPSWAPVETLDKLNVENTERIHQRTTAIKEEYLKTYTTGDKQLMYGRGAIPIDFGYASECNIYFDRDFLTETERRETCVIIGIWLSDTCSQYWKLKSKVSSFTFADNRFQELKIDDYGIVKLRVWPYIKMCHFNRGIAWLFMDSDAGNNKVDDWIKLGDDFTGKWKREKWRNYCNKVEQSGLFSGEKLQEFRNEFDKIFVKSDRNYLTVSVGFEMYVYLTFEEAQKIDAGFYKNISMVTLIHCVLEEMKKLIEE